MDPYENMMNMMHVSSPSSSPKQKYKKNKIPPPLRTYINLRRVTETSKAIQNPRESRIRVKEALRLTMPDAGSEIMNSYFLFITFPL